MYVMRKVRFSGGFTSHLLDMSAAEFKEAPQTGRVTHEKVTAEQAKKHIKAGRSHSTNLVSTKAA